MNKCNNIIKYCIRTANTKYYTKHSDQVWCPILLPGLVVYWLNGQKYNDIISFYFTRTQNKNCNYIVVYQVLLATQVWPKFIPISYFCIGN